MARSRSGVKVQFETKAILNRMHKAWALVNEEDLPRAFDYELAASKWEWVGTTERANGQTVSSPRSIIDEGDLADAYARKRQGKENYLHSWQVEHALATHEGAQLKNGGLIYPRAWTEEPVRAIPELFAERFRTSQ